MSSVSGHLLSSVIPLLLCLCLWSSLTSSSTAQSVTPGTLIRFWSPGSSPYNYWPGSDSFTVDAALHDGVQTHQHMYWVDSTYPYYLMQGDTNTSVVLQLTSWVSGMPSSAVSGCYGQQSAMTVTQLVSDLSGEGIFLIVTGWCPNTAIVYVALNGTWLSYFPNLCGTNAYVTAMAVSADRSHLGIRCAYTVSPYGQFISTYNLAASFTSPPLTATTSVAANYGSVGFDDSNAIYYLTSYFYRGSSWTTIASMSATGTLRNVSTLPSATATICYFSRSGGAVILDYSSVQGAFVFWLLSPSGKYSNFTVSMPVVQLAWYSFQFDPITNNMFMQYALNGYPVFYLYATGFPPPAGPSSSSSTSPSFSSSSSSTISRSSSVSPASSSLGQHTSASSSLSSPTTASSSPTSGTPTLSASAAPSFPSASLLLSSSASAFQASSSAAAPTSAAVTSTPVPTSSTAAASLCILTYSLFGNIDYPWSTATSAQFIYNTTIINTPLGPAVTILSGSGSRVYTNRVGESFTTSLTLAPVGSGIISSDNLLYLGSSTPLDSNGLSWTLSSAVQLPGQGPLPLYTQLSVFNQSGVIIEGGSSRVDGQGSAFLATVPGFVNLTIAASNINSLAPVYGTCSAPITFTNGLRGPTQPSVSNGGTTIFYSYSISDGVSYTVVGNLTLTTTSAFANVRDQLGNPYQIVTNVTGTRLYTYLPTSQQLLSAVSGLSTVAATTPSSQLFYPYALLSSSPGVYSINSAPFFDDDGVEFNFSPSAPMLGLSLGQGIQYNTTSLRFLSSGPSTVLTESFYVNLPIPTDQQQRYLFL